MLKSNYWHGFSHDNDVESVRSHGSHLENMSISISRPPSKRCLGTMASDVQGLVSSWGSQACDVLQVPLGYLV